MHITVRKESDQVIDAKKFLNSLKRIHVDFYTGVPDSQLKFFCNEIYRNTKLGIDHIVTANEGAAVGLASGHYLASGKPALVYMQNSGIGNALNPIVSLADEHIYKIPMVFVIGWRGEPDTKDEPQHVFQGMITEELMNVLHIPYVVLSKQTTEEEVNAYIQQAGEIIGQERSMAFLVKKGAFEGDDVAYPSYGTMTREEAMEVIIAQESVPSVYVSTTGKLSRELYELREQRKETHGQDFLTVGSMGHASMIAMGIALEKNAYRVWCLDGDGAALMHMGSMALVAHTNCKNMVHVVFNNGAHETVGGMPVVYGRADFSAIAKACGYQYVEQAEDIESLQAALLRIQASKGTCFLEVKVSLESRKNLGRPSNTPMENKKLLMDLLEANKKE
ncbi:MAG: phosphonopyruvate decarboxylase [Lachnospiraceae bacterium]